MATHHHNRSRFLIKQRVSLDQPWLMSRFCLAPSGDGFGDRLSQSMMMGCVPVIIQPAVSQPFEGLLPYDAFSMRFGYNDIPVLHELLRNVSDAEHARRCGKVRAGLQVARYRREGVRVCEVWGVSTRT